MPEKFKADDFLTIYAESKVKVNNLPWVQELKCLHSVDWKKTGHSEFCHLLKIFRSNECVEQNIE